VRRGWGSPAWSFSAALLWRWLVFLAKLIKLLSFSLFPSFGFDFSDLFSPKMVQEIPVIKWVILCDCDDFFDELLCPDVPLEDCIPGKFFQKAAALFSAPAFGNSTTVTDIVVDRFWLMWNGCEGVCPVGFIEGITNKRYVGLLASCVGVGTNCHG